MGKGTRIAVLAALMAGMLIPAASAAAKQYVALGDSYAAGVGSRVFYEESGSCKRSPEAYAPKIASAKGYTPLFFALQSKVAQASLALLDAGADARAVLPDGTTVIAAALLVNDVPFAMQVVSRGADVKERDREGRQLIHIAAANGNARSARACLLSVPSIVRPPLRRCRCFAASFIERARSFCGTKGSYTIIGVCGNAKGAGVMDAPG